MGGESIRLHDIRRTAADRMLNVLGGAPYVVDLGSFRRNARTFDTKPAGSS
jgi:hypothetical protein